MVVRVYCNSDKLACCALLIDKVHKLRIGLFIDKQMGIFQHKQNWDGQDGNAITELDFQWNQNENWNWKPTLNWKQIL